MKLRSGLAFAVASLLALTIGVPAEAANGKLELLRVGSHKVIVETVARTESWQVGLAWGELRFDSRGCLYYQRLREEGNLDEPNPLPATWVVPRVVVLPYGTRLSKDSKSLSRGKYTIPIGKPFKGLPSGVDFSFTVTKAGRARFPSECRPAIGAEVFLLALGGIGG